MRTAHPPMHRLVVVLAAASLVTAAAVPTAQAAPTSRPSVSERAAGWIVFERFDRREPDGPVLKDLFLVRPDGSGERRLLDDPVAPVAHRVHPDWSPDGALVAFEVLQDDGSDAPPASVWVVGVDGRNPRTVASCGSAPCTQYSYPAWSPDGRHLAMVRYGRYSDGSCCTSHLVVTDVVRGPGRRVALTNERVVQEFTDSDVGTTYDSYFEPAWSPDGRRLAYEVEQYDAVDPFPFLGTRVAVVDVRRAGRPAAFVTPIARQAGSPDWMPGGHRLVVATYPLSPFQVTARPSNIYTVRPDGTGLRQVTDASTDGSYRLGTPHPADDGACVLVTVARASDGQRLDSVDLAVLDRGGLPREIGVKGSDGQLQPRRASCP